jgi:hypothetical protein
MDAALRIGRWSYADTDWCMDLCGLLLLPVPWHGLLCLPPPSAAVPGCQTFTAHTELGLLAETGGRSAPGLLCQGGLCPPSPLPSDSMCRACMVGLHVSQLLLMVVDMLTLMDSSAGVGP